jgi:Ca2+-binding RTX toxin-like protein
MRFASKIPFVSLAAIATASVLALGGSFASGSAPKGAQCHGKAATIVGTKGDDTALKGTGHRDVIAARSGDDVIQGRDGDDLICGGGGHDAIKDGAGNDHVYGNGSSDLLIGGDDDDQIEGNGGDDQIAGGKGKDICSGGPGADIAVKSTCEKIKSAKGV